MNEAHPRIASRFLGEWCTLDKKYRSLEVFPVKPGDVLLENVTTVALMATWLGEC